MLVDESRKDQIYLHQLQKENNIIAVTQEEIAASYKDAYWLIEQNTKLSHKHKTIAIIYDELTQFELAKYDYLISPYKHIVKHCNSVGFYCAYVPIKKIVKIPKIDAPKISAAGCALVTLDIFNELPNVCYYYEANFNVEDWAVATGKTLIKVKDLLQLYANCDTIYTLCDDSFEAVYAPPHVKLECQHEHISHIAASSTLKMLSLFERNRADFERFERG